MKTSAPFTLRKVKNKPNFYVAFRSPETGKFMSFITTHKADMAEAYRVALDWLQNGIPKKEGKLDLKQFSLLHHFRKADITKTEASLIASELQRRGFLKTYVLVDTKQDTDFVEFLLNFWNFDKSPYVQEKLRRKHGIHRRYVNEQLGTIKRFWIPYFKGKLLGEITKQDICGFINHFDTNTPIHSVPIPQSAKRKNTIIRAGTIPLSWAHKQEMVDTDVTKGIVGFSGKAAERQILTPDLVQAVFSVPWNDERAKLANMLAMVTGMRAGEIQGLRIQDLGQDCLYVRHSWNFQDGLKTTKNNESRIVEVPFPGLMRNISELAKGNPHGVSMESYVFWAQRFSNKPIEQDIFRRDLKHALIKIGLNQETAKTYTFHGWRHYFTAYMRPRIDEKLLQSQTGHKTLVMLNHYAGHKITGDRERIRTAQIETFGGLLPEYDVNSQAAHLPV
jgi:integrase